MILLTINKWLLHYGCKSSCTVLQSTCNVALWEFNTPCCTLRVHHRNTASVTWSCFHQSAKQFVVGHTIIQDIYSCCMNQLFPSVLWHSWLDDGKDIRPITKPVHRISPSFTILSTKPIYRWSQLTNTLHWTLYTYLYTLVCIINRFYINNKLTGKQC